jgi:16S rRNA (cytidine1402-2'-O)-methyltransferase
MGILFLVSTPIGNLGDISLRAIDVLASVQCILCEDTRRTGIFFEELRKKNLIKSTWHPLLLSYYDEIENSRIPEIIEKLQNDETIALISDAGTPLISDPGFRLVSAARKKNIQVIAVPGASAALTALISSGLSAHQFLFIGYLPEKQGKRNEILEAIQTSSMSTKSILNPTYIIYSAPHKLHSAFQSMTAVFGNIDVVVARELTKIHEEVWTGVLSDAMEKFKEPKGEFVVLFTLSKT